MTTATLCYSCKSVGRDIVYTDLVDRGYCQECAVPIASPQQAMSFLMATIPYQVGDRVHAKLAGQVLDGTGVIDDISIELRHGGTPVYPAFHVVLDEKAYPDAPDSCWYTEVCLTKAQ